MSKKKAEEFWQKLYDECVEWKNNNPIKPSKLWDVEKDKSTKEK